MANGDRLVVINRDLFIARHVLRTVAANVHPFVALHLLLLVELSVNIDQLLSLRIVQRNFVVTAATVECCSTSSR